MGRVLALDVDAATIEQLRHCLTPLEIGIEPTTQHDGMHALDREPESVEALLLGAGVADPLQTAQRAYAVQPRLPVLILTTIQHERQLRGALQFTPLIGEHVQCLAGEDSERVATRVCDTVELARKRARYQATTSALNRQLSETVTRAPSPAAALLNRLLRHVPIGVAVTDRQGAITALNAAGARTLGVNEHAALGTALPSYFAPADRERWERLMNMLAQRNDDSSEHFMGLDEQRHFDVTAASLTGRDGAPGTLVLFRDVTEHHQLVARERTARHEAEEANRAKDEFLAMLGHELRNPLSPIVLALQRLRMRGIDPSAARDHEVIERQIQHLQRLVDDLLDVSRIARGQVELKRESVELAAIVDKAVEQVTPLLVQRAHRLDMDVPRRGLVVRGDATRLAQVASNLLINAAKYTDPRGLISLRARRIDDTIELMVRDNGSGIAPQLLPRVFDLFVQGDRKLDRSQGGLGLGLAIVRNLVALHGGEVAVDSPGVGLGSTFTLRLPASDSAAPLPFESAVEGHVTAAVVPLRLLIVDDNVDAADMLAMMMDDAGYQTRVEHDGAMALAIAPSFAPDVCLLDIGLPGMTGYELAQRLRTLQPRVRLVAISGYGQDSDREKAREAGFDEHLVKPADLTKLQSLLARFAAELKSTPE